jgi:regulator of protease activity HflC (stomatin/prohibitin superfamily)
MTDFLRLIGDWISFLWPLKQILAYEAGVLFVFGRFWKVVPAGQYFVFPFLMHMQECSIAPGLITTARLDLTLTSGKAVSCTASCYAQVVDPFKAICLIEDHEHATRELVHSVIADRVCRVKHERLEPENRAALLRDLTGWIAAEAIGFGVEVTKVRFSSFVDDIRVFRLIQDT